MKLDRFSECFNHNKNRYHHPKEDLDFSPTNIIFINDNLKGSKRIRSGNISQRRIKQVEFGPKPKENKILQIEGKSSLASV